MPVVAGEVDHVSPYVVQGGGEGGLRAEEFTRSIQDAEWKLVYVPSERYQRLQQGVEYDRIVLTLGVEQTNATRLVPARNPTAISAHGQHFSALVD